jgi:hypothetical protein
MGRFQSALNDDLRAQNAKQMKARRRAAAKLAAAAGFGLEHLEERALFTGTITANPGGPYTVNEGSAINLNGSASSDTGGTISSYKWDLNYNGTFVASITTANPQLHYTAGAAQPQRTIALEVVGTDGTSTVATTTLTNNDVLPTINVTGGGTVNRGATNTINWTYSDPGNEAVTGWVINWGDGSSTQTLAPSATSATHVYSQDGSFTATVTSDQTVEGNPVTSNGTAAFTVVPVLPIVTLTGNATVNELSTYTLGFTAVDPNEIENWAIDWGDGTSEDIFPGNATSATHAYATHGNYTITATAIDDAGDSGPNTKAIVSEDVPPAPVVSGAPTTAINEGDTVNLSATPNDPGSSTTAYAWTVTSTNPSFSLPQNTVLTNSTLSFVAGYTGSYTATCTVTDDAGETGYQSKTFTANAVAPTVTLTSGYSTSVNKGQTVSLTANASDPGTNDTYTYAWSATLNGQPYTLPSGSDPGTNSTFNFVAGRSGSFVVSVLVTDRDHGTDGASTSTITAAAVNPTDVISGTPGSAIGEGTGVALTATPSDAGVDESFTYNWSITKGGNPLSGTASDSGEIGSYQGAAMAFDGDSNTKWYDSNSGPASLTYQYNSAAVAINSYSITSASDVAQRDPKNWTLQASNDGVNWVTLDTETNQVFANRGQANAYSFSNTTPYQYYQLAISANAGGLSYGTQLAELKLGSTNATLNFTPLDEGAYAATAVVTDSDGSTVSTTTQNITVNDVAPTVAITGTPTTSTNEGTAINLAATAMEASTNRTYTYLWSVTRTYNGNTTSVTLPNGSNTSAAFSFTPATEGTYVATCAVTDDEGGSNSAYTTNMTVATVPATVSITGDSTTEINESTAVNLSASATEAGSGHTFTDSWSVTKNGSPYQISTPGVASATAGYTPEDAFDGDDSTGWFSGYNSGTPSLEYDLGSGHAAVATSYGIYPYGNHVFDPSAWTFSGSNDGTNWTQLDSRSGQSLTTGQTNSFSFSNSTAYRYYSLKLLQGGFQNGFIINELSIADANGNSLINSGLNAAGSTLGFTPTTEGNYVATVTVTDEDGHIVSQNSNTITVDNVPPTVTVSGTPNGSIAEGTAVNLTSTATEPGPGGYTYLWTVMNGSTPVSLTGNASATTSALSFTPVAEGTYVATLKVTDSEGGVTTQASQNIVVTPVAPAVTMTGVPQSSVNELSPLTLGVTTSEVNPANTETFAWTVTKNGNAYTLPSSVATNTSSLTFTPDDPGTWIATCVVTNSETLSTTSSSGNITVAAIPLTASIGLSDGIRKEGTAITATAQIGSTGATDPVTYSWSVQRDGSAYTPAGNPSTTGSTFTFTPSDEGSYVIDLTATNSGGPVSTQSSAIVVADVAPTVAVTGAPTGNAPEGTAITLGTTVTQTGTNDGVATYAWSVTDGGQPVDLTSVNTSGSSLTFTPMNAGSYVATVTVTNNSDGQITGGQTQQSSSAITVVNVPPVVTVTGPSGPVADGSTLNYSSSVVEAGNNTLSYLWSVKRNGHTIELPAGTITNASTLSFAVGRAGSFVATCTVTDSEMGVGSGSSNTLSVTDVAPVVSVSGEPTGSIAAGTAVSLSATATDAGAAEHLSYAWTVTRNNGAYTLLSNVVTNTSTLNFTPDKVGTYVATVVVTDSDSGATSHSSQSIGVTDVAPTVTVTGMSSAVNEGQTITFSGTATNPTINDTFSYAWTVTYNGNAFTLPVGTNASSSSLSFIAPQGGTYVATATVTDSASSTGSNTGSATVNWLTPSVSITGAPTHSVSAGSAVALTAAPTEAGSGHTYSYVWSVTRNGIAYTLPQGVVTTGSTFTFNPGRAGNFIATVVATDEDLQTATASTAAIAVTDVAPAVGISGAPLAAIAEGNAINLTATPTSPGADETFTYSWSVTKGGLPYTLPNGVVTNAASLNFTPGVAGSYVASVTVTDLDNGALTASTAAMVVSATAANVTVTGAPGSAVNAGAAINLSATATNSGPGEQFTYLWSVTLNGQTYALPQGTASTAANFSFTTTDAGLYVATCVATDTSGQAGSGNSGNITVNAVAPTVTISGTPMAAVNEGTPVTLTAVPADANTADTYTYAWSVTRNNAAFVLPVNTVTNTAGFTFTPTDPGSYVATVSVVDKANLTASHTSTFTANDVAPVVSIAGAPQAPIGVGTAMSFTGSTTSIGSTETISSYAWSVTKDGTAYTPVGNPSTTTSSFGFTPDGPGTYVVTLAATDNYTQTGTASTSSIIVRAVAPSVSVTGTTGTINEGDPVSLAAAATDPTTGDTYTYAWTVTRNGAAYTLPNTVATNLSTLNFNANQVGTYVATVTVVDAYTEQTIATSSSIIAADVPPTVAITGAPVSSIAENSGPVTLTATPTEPGSGQTYTYAWTVTKNGVAYLLPNSVVTNASTLTFTPGRTGSYVATCNVLDGNGGTGSASTGTIAVTAVNPTVTISGTPTGSVAEGTPVALTATATDPGVGDTFSYAWVITLNGQAYTPAVTTGASTAALSFTPDQPGAYVATCTVRDADSAVGTAAADITATTVNPTVTIAGAPTGSTPEGTAINLTTTTTSPRVNDTYTYSWTVTDGGTPVTLPNTVATNTSSLSFTPTVDGNYVATVAVTDLDSAVTTVSTATMPVTNVPPTVSITGLPTTTINTGDSFTATAVATEPGAGNYTYSWTLSHGGVALSTGHNAAFSGTAGLAGTYRVHLTVTDGEGGSTTATAQTITVQDVAPTVAITGAPQSSIAEGTPISLGSTATDPGTTDGETLSYLWTVTQNGNSYPVTNATGSTLNFTPGVYGTYVATLTVTDSQGTSTSASSTITVTDVAPTSTLAAVATSLQNAPVTFAGTFADAGTADTHTIVWNYGDGTSQTFAATAANALTPSHAYATAGTYTATMTVTDSGGLSSTSTQQVSVVAAIVAADPFSSGKTALFVDGAAAGTQAIKFYSEAGGRVKVTINGTQVGVFAPTGHIIATATGSGNDSITVQSTLTNGAVLYANSGADSLYGGGGNNILVSGSGNDSLYGGAGADILVGGTGKDVLTAGTGNDLLVGGSWPYASNQSTLAGIDAQWTRTDESFANVVHQLRGVQTGSLAGSTLVSTANITNNFGEFLIGGSGRDWFLPVNGDVDQNVTTHDVVSNGAVSAAKKPTK